jgi:hypothetical protein
MNEDEQNNTKSNKEAESFDDRTPESLIFGRSRGLDIERNLAKLYVHNLPDAAKSVEGFGFTAMLMLVDLSEFKVMSHVMVETQIAKDDWRAWFRKLVGEKLTQDKGQFEEFVKKEWRKLKPKPQDRKGRHAAMHSICMLDGLYRLMNKTERTQERDCMFRAIKREAKRRQTKRAATLKAKKQPIIEKKVSRQKSSKTGASGVLFRDGSEKNNLRDGAKKPLKIGTRNMLDSQSKKTSSNRTSGESRRSVKSRKGAKKG